MIVAMAIDAHAPAGDREIAKHLDPRAHHLARRQPERIAQAIGVVIQDGEDREHRDDPRAVDAEQQRHLRVADDAGMLANP